MNPYINREMKRILFVFFVVVCFHNNAFTAVFRGRVTSADMKPVPYATVFIHEISTGIATDTDGCFSISLNPGIYTVEVSSLGYKRVKFQVDVLESGLDKSIILKEEVYRLDDVYFRSGGENRAYHVMRQAIARAPFHRREVRAYSSSVYLKGSVKVTKLPALLKMQAGKKKTRLVLNKTFVVESNSKIEYTWPDRYEERVIAFSSTIPAEIDPSDITAVINSSVYDREFYGKLSPLAPEAFRYYKFVYEGITRDNGNVVNKIRIIPKKGDSKLISGHIYIADDLWRVTYARFLIRETGVEVDLKVNYNETGSGVLMPTSYAMDIDVSLMGVKAEGFYNSSITYNYVDSGSEESLSSDGFVAKEVGTEREARSIARQNARRIEEQIHSAERYASEDDSLDKVESVKRRNDLEIIKMSNITRKVDSMATSRDSSYWNSVRTVPLREEEIVAYNEADSLKEEYERLVEDESQGKLRRSTGNIIFDRILYDSRYKVSDKLTLGYGGLSRVVGGFSFTDGYWFGQNFYSSYKFDSNRVLVVKPSLYYSQLRKKLMYRVDGSLSHSPFRQGSLYFSFGDFSRDISDNSSISDFISSYASFFFGMNPKKYLSVKWVSVGNSIDISNGLNLDVSVSWSRVLPLENAEVKSLGGKRPENNLPANIYDALPQSHSNMDYNIGVIYTPRYYYRVVNGRKIYVRSSWPTFGLSLRGSFPGLNGDYASWGELSMSVDHRFRTGLYSQLIYGVEAGTFFNNERIFLDNFRHFRASDIMVTEKGFGNDFLLVDPYFYSTNSEWVKYNIEFRSNYILLNNLSFLNSALYTEALYVKGLWLPDKKAAYYEAGYSFGIHGALKAGLFTAFNEIGYVGTGFRLEVPFLGDIYR